MQNKNLLTKKGYEKIKKEYEELKNVKRPAALERLQRARAMGDLRENSDYHAAREELGWIDGRLQELEEILKNAEVVEESQDDSIVQLGDTVELEVSGSKITITLVGEHEGDPLNNKFSINSPLGSALLGKSINTEVEVSTPSGKKLYKIVKISRD